MEYKDYHIPIEKREEELFSTIKQLDNDSFTLFSDIIEKRNDKAALVGRYQTLSGCYQETQDAFDYLYLQELKNLSFANKRLFGKIFLALNASFYATVVNRFLGIASFVALMKMASSEFKQEKEYYEAALDQYHYEDVTRIGRTLENCDRFLKPAEFVKK